jgi:hypothetical protein
MLSESKYFLKLILDSVGNRRRRDDRLRVAALSFREFGFLREQFDRRRSRGIHCRKFSLKQPKINLSESQVYYLYLKVFY